MAPELARDMAGSLTARGHRAEVIGDGLAALRVGPEVTDNLAHIQGGAGGYREDRGYEWSAGI
jgi:hypothetical protein